MLTITCTSEILPAEAAAIEVETESTSVMLHSNYHNSFLSNPKPWQRSILLNVSRAKKWSALPRLVALSVVNYNAVPDFVSFVH